MSPAEATIAATALVDCSPQNGAVRTFQQRFNDGVGDGVSTTQKACLDKVISRQAVIDVLAAEFSDRSAAGQAAFKKLITDAEPGCGVH